MPSGPSSPGPPRAFATGAEHRRLVQSLFAAASALQQQGRWQEAEQAYRSLLARDRDHFEAIHNLGYLHLQRGELAEAAKLARKAVKLRPRSADAHNTLGLVQHTGGLFREASASFRQALANDPNRAAVHNNLGGALRHLDRHEEAIASFRRAVALRPDYAGAWRNLGNALMSLGRGDEARAAYEAAVAAAPRWAAAYHNLIDCKRFAPGDPQLAAMEALAHDADNLPEQGRVHLHYALARALEHTGDFARSFQHLVTANTLRRNRIPYDEADTLRLFDRVKAAFPAAAIQVRAGQGEPSPAPVFVIGMMRSGTTLIEQILASHPRIVGAGERGDLRLAIEAAIPPARYPEAISYLTGSQLRRIGQRYLSSLRAGLPAADRVIDKMPMNYLFAGVIAQALPGARIIHARRDPADTCLSCFGTLFRGDLPFTHDLQELGRYYRAYEALMQHWRETLPPGMMIEIQYEALVSDLEMHARRLIAHGGLEWDPACLNFHATERAVMTVSSGQVRQPLYRWAVGRWRPYRLHLQPLLDALGYDPDPTGNLIGN